MTEQTLLIFDIDDTLCQTKEIGDNCFIEVFEQMYQCQLKNIEWENFTNVTDTALYNDLFKLNFTNEATAMETQIFKQSYYNQLLQLTQKQSKRFKVVNDANEFLFQCKEKNISIAVATGSWLDIALLKMSACKLSVENIPISSSDDDFRRTEIVTSVIKKSEQFYAINHFSNIVYFGDGIWDYECCQQLNIKFIGVDIANTKKLIGTETKLLINNFINTDILFDYINSKEIK